MSYLSAAQNSLIIPFSGTTAPDGWMLCEGQAISRTKYSRLFSIIGTAYGIGDGTSTFNLPDLRGQFLRGVDRGSNRDPDKTSRTAVNGGNAGDNVGSVQTHNYISHTHSPTVSLASSNLDHNHGNANSTSGRGNFAHNHSIYLSANGGHEHGNFSVEYWLGLAPYGNRERVAWEATRYIGTSTDGPLVITGYFDFYGWLIPIYESILFVAHGPQSNMSGQLNHVHNSSSYNGIHTHSVGFKIANSGSDARPKNIYTNFIIKL
jgi:microcystin-dependent protein